MNKAIAEKILSNKAGVDAKAGDIVISPVDLVFTDDVSGPLTLRQIKESGRSLANPKATLFFLDHCTPSPRVVLSNDQMFIRAFGMEQGPLETRSD